MTTLLEAAAYGEQKIAGKLPARFITAWWYAENGPDWPVDNNPGNISFEGEGIPAGGVFTGVTAVKENKVCVYGTWQEGVDAWAALLEAPTQAHGGTKSLTVDLADLEALSTSIANMARRVGESNWAASHYEECDQYGIALPDSWPGKLIFDAYHNTVISSWFETPQTPDPVSSPPVETKALPHRVSYVVREGDTLSQIAVRFGYPLRVLVSYNDIHDANVITAGEVIRFPETFRVRHGQTMAQVASITDVPEDLIVRVNQVSRVTNGTLLYV